VSQLVPTGAAYTATPEVLRLAGRVELLACDVSSLASVRGAAAACLARSPTLNLLVCNAGVMQMPTREESVDGVERQLATNYLGHFLLFHLLRDALLQGAAASPGFHSRLIHVSSSGHHGSEIQWDDLQLTGPGAYEPLKAYGQSKLAQIYMANSVDRHYGGRGLHALSVMPGGILTGRELYS
jgi:NAD(P)-dependent dehydrogenase (short-subunit alcohol dehydrogenase family)